MANPREVVPQQLMPGFSFIDWEGLSENEYEKLNKIINNPAACAGVKLPFPVDRNKFGNDQTQCFLSPPNQQERGPPSKEQDGQDMRNRGDSRANAVFQANIPPPPPSHPAVPPVVAYPVPVHHWASQAPPPVPPGTSHFPLPMQGGYVFPNQPPPPLVTNGDAATIAFVAAMSAGQPVYAIPGVPLQSLPNHYPAGSGFPQVEAMDLTVPVVAQQPVTVHHFVQPEAIVFTPSHPLHATVPLNQSQNIPPVTVHSTPAKSSQNLAHVQASHPYVLQPSHNTSSNIPSDSHVVHIAPDLDPPVNSSPAAKVKTLQQSEMDNSVVHSNTESHKSQAKNNVASSKTTPVSSLSSRVEFVGPMMFDSDQSASSTQEPATNGSVAVSHMKPTARDLIKVNTSGPAENVSNSHDTINSTQSGPAVPVGAKAMQSPLPERSVPSDSNEPHIEKASPAESKKSEVKEELSISTSPSPAVPQPQTPKMWSSLFGKSKASTPVSPTSPTPVALVPGSGSSSGPTEEVKSIRYWQEQEKAEAKSKSGTPQKVVPVGIQNDPIAPRILDVLSSLPVVHTPLVIQPRGLVNGSNVCFMNATLQVLMGCPPFIHLFRAFKNLPPRQNGGSSTPIFDSLLEFVNSFQNGQRVKSQGSRNKKGAHLDINVGQPFSPASLLSVAQDILGLRIGIQHDAEEFLSKILMICHEELENILKINQSYALNNNNDETAKNNGHVDGSDLEDSPEADDEEDESWQKVGPKNHHVETNVNDCGQTPLSSIFSGLSRSCLTRETGRNSDTLDCFFTLKLDIQGENVHSVADALQRLNVSETLHDIDGGKIQGQRRMFFDVLPPVLIMHLKLFQYSDGSGKKIQKKIDFDVDLTIPKETLSRVGKNKYMSPKSRSYKLFGVVNHHGLKMTDGHYTSDVFLPIASGWLRFDDSEVFAINEKQVLQHSDRHMPYLLFYRRMDVY